MSQLNMYDLFCPCLEAQPPYFDEKITKKSQKMGQKMTKKNVKKDQDGRLDRDKFPWILCH